MVRDFEQALFGDLECQAWDVLFMPRRLAIKAARR
jgi:hypothetical protein